MPAARPLSAAWLTTLLLALALCILPSAAQPAASPTPASLPLAIHTLLTQDRFAPSTWGILVESLDSGTVLFATNQHRLLQPGSTAKLFTAAFALDSLGTHYRIRTPILATRPPHADGTLRSDLVILGQGDFSFAGRFHNDNPARSLDPIIRAIRAAGIRRVKGDLVGDARLFTGPPWGNGWTWDDLDQPYGAEVAALNINDNATTLLIQPGPRPGSPCSIRTTPQAEHLRLLNRTSTSSPGSPPDIRVRRLPGSADVFVEGQLPVNSSDWHETFPVPQPSRWFLQLLRDRLRLEGIRLDGRLRLLEWPADTAPKSVVATPTLVELASTESPPLHELLAATLKDSQNQYAQLLLLHASKTHPVAPYNACPPDASAHALAQLNLFTSRLHLPTNEILLDDGAGLSRNTRLSAAALVALLRAMNQHPHARTFLESLPVAGTDGNLRERMLHSAAAGKLRAKTGTLRHAQSLAGYTETAAGERLVFAILVNNHPGPDPAAARADLDQLGILLSSLSQRTPATQ